MNSAITCSSGVPTLFQTLPFRQVPHIINSLRVDYPMGSTPTLVSYNHDATVVPWNVMAPHDIISLSTDEQIFQKSSSDLNIVGAGRFHASFMLMAHKYWAQPYTIQSLGRSGAPNLCYICMLKGTVETNPTVLN